jgi:phosphonate transport system ATP-binding protein
MAPALGVRGLTKRYGSALAIADVSFEVASDEMVAILGPSGAGKTTLLRCLNGTVRPNSGSVELAGRDISQLRGRARRQASRSIGFVYQQLNLVGRLSVLTNVLMARLSDAPFLRWTRYSFSQAELDLAFHCLDRVGLAERAYQRADTLSGGQQQRVALARALCQQPAMMLADEPVSSLDPRLADRILQDLAEVSRGDGIPTLVNLHTVELARRFATRVIGLNAGRIVVDGPIASLDDSAVLAAIYDGAADVELGPALRALPSRTLNQLGVTAVVA